MVFFIVLFVTFAVFAVFEIVDPRLTWQIFESWRFKCPNMNEPSNEAYAMRRMSAFIALIAIVVALSLMIPLLRQ